MGILLLLLLNSAMAFDEGDDAGHEIMREKEIPVRKHKNDNTKGAKTGKPMKAAPKLEFTVTPSFVNPATNEVETGKPKDNTIDMTPPKKEADSFSKTTKDIDQAIMNANSKVETGKVSTAITDPLTPKTPPPLGPKDNTVNMEGVSNDKYKFSKDGKEISGEEARKTVAGGGKVKVTKDDGTTKTIGSGKEWSDNNC